MESVGARLKKIRLEKGLSLEEAHNKTKIRLNILNAIEEDSLINLNPVYVRGFLKIYCKFLGQDPKDFISGYKEHTEVNYGISSLKKPGVPSSTPAKKFIFYCSRFEIKTLLIPGLIIISAIIIFIIGKTIFSRVSSLSQGKNKAQAASYVAAVNKKQEGRRMKPKVLAGKVTEIPAAKFIRLDMRAREDCLVEVKVDGRLLFRGVLRKGRSESWQAKERIVLFLGNAGVADLEINGKRIPQLGKKGQPRRNIVITKSGLEMER
ncbi:MAG: RodZ domain-containing protein [Candidatus Omnitrophota bacterium]